MNTVNRTGSVNTLASSQRSFCHSNNSDMQFKAYSTQLIKISGFCRALSHKYSKQDGRGPGSVSPALQSMRPNKVPVTSRFDIHRIFGFELIYHAIPFINTIALHYGRSMLKTVEDRYRQKLQKHDVAAIDVNARRTARFWPPACSLFQRPSANHSPWWKRRYHQLFQERNQTKNL